MDGTLVDGSLTRAARFAVATGADEADIRHLLRENPMHGAIRVSFEREPDYFLGANLAGGTDQTIVAYEDGRLVCMGRCTRRECWVNGKERTVGYLAELRLDHRARRRFSIVRDGYQFFREVSPDDELLFTSIAADNLRARRLLESGLRGLPQYEFVGSLLTLLIAVPGRARPTSNALSQATPADLPALVKLLNDHGRRHHFAAVWTAERLGGLAAHGLGLDRILLMKRDGRLAACGGLWDQRGFRQTVIRGYGGFLRWALPFVNWTHQALRRPRLPAPGSALAQAFLSPLAFEAGADSLLPDFIEACFPYAASAGVDWLTVALPAQDDRTLELRRRFHVRTWPTRVYRVRWSTSKPVEDLAGPATLLPEVGLL